MWIFPTKKEIKKEFKKVSESSKERDIQINKLKEKTDNNSLEIATLKGAYAVLLTKSLSQSQSSPKKSQGNFETKLMNRIKKSKKALIMAEMMKLIDSHSVIEMFEIIVRERGLCSKASFYRYIASLKSQSLIITKTNENK